jgi:hypothetical protein
LVSIVIKRMALKHRNLQPWFFSELAWQVWVCIAEKDFKRVNDKSFLLIAYANGREDEFFSAVV